MLIEENQSLKKFNTFGIEAKTRWFAEVNHPEDLVELYSKGLLKEPLLILGGGSNLLLTKDFEGLTVKVNLKGIEILPHPDSTKKILKAMAGETWHDLVIFSIRQGLGGIENLSLIPGKAGAAPMQNIGAYGVELKDVFDHLTAFDLQTGKEVRFQKEECNFGYRESIFKRNLKGKYIITSIALVLSKNHEFKTDYGAIEEQLKLLGQPKSIENISNAVIEIRRSKLPDPEKIGNAGSFFKNPSISKEQFEKIKNNFPEIPSYPSEQNLVKVPAGWLIEKCGFKGLKKGNCGVHEKQALVLVNFGGASGSEIFELSENIIQTVLEKFGILLEREVNIL